MLDGLAIYQGDIVLGPADEVERHLLESRLDSQAVYRDAKKICFPVCIYIDHDYTWPDGVIPLCHRRLCQQ